MEEKQEDYKVYEKIEGKVSKPKKVGDVLNQIAIISELIENINFESKESSIIFEFEREEFDRIFELVQKKLHKVENKQSERFSIRVGEVEFLFITTNFYTQTEE